MNGEATETFIRNLPDNKTIYSNEEVLKALGATGGTYKGTWTVIESDAEGNPTKLVSTSAVTYCTLGEDNNLDKCISDYKNAVDILDTAAQEATGIPSARSITIEDIETLAGIQDSDKGDYYNKEYTYNYTDHKDQIFVDESGNTVKLDAEGKEVTLKFTTYQYNLTEDQKTAIKSLAYGNYWTASLGVSFNSEAGYFKVIEMMSGRINPYTDDLFNSRGNASGKSRGVHAVVSI